MLGPTRICYKITLREEGENGDLLTLYKASWMKPTSFRAEQ